MTTDRMRRVDEAVRGVLSDAVSKDLKDPRIGFVTVTDVKTSPDLRRARVFVTVLGDKDERASALAGLQSSVGVRFMRSSPATRRCSRPCADCSPASVACRSSSAPSTVT